ncbi:hypothetical protein BOW53_03440 [Solemya pervernicosa gill symbiont]|uniref:DUF3426 domain-containing protein n=2 Tax=Gammaproteobacteria incertae sedis TaxID=118884 RepID=A0A6N0I0L1_9GAMM|nr:DUF3426 domain-containing protein [Candidatus Reidiella endopervernicosa]OOZ41575.1 hypothetical protein BOW53_03440 [Solemya pervernicosa gill symbiont]QKQ27981.1 DUF3426 domain-containing protein [Candidatus Reidiella endopervernicosa]
MYTQCPECQTIFEVSDADLAVASGKVRCGSCNQVFKADEHLMEQLPEPTPVAIEEDIVDLSTPTAAIDEPEILEIPDTPAEAAPQPAAEDFAKVLAETELEKEQQEAAAAQKSATKVKHSGGLLSTLAWSFASLLLISALLLQGLYVLRVELSQIAFLAEPIEMLCDTLDCEIPERRDLQRIEVVERDVRSHPDNAKALLISAKLVSTAEFTQPYPTLRLSLANINGQTTAARDFQPWEYIADETDLDEGMAANTPTTVRLEVIDPGSDAASFQIELL